MQVSPADAMRPARSPLRAWVNAPASRIGWAPRRAPAILRRHSARHLSDALAFKAFRKTEKSTNLYGDIMCLSAHFAREFTLTDSPERLYQHQSSPRRAEEAGTFTFTSL